MVSIYKIALSLSLFIIFIGMLQNIDHGGIVVEGETGPESDEKVTGIVDGKVTMILGVLSTFIIVGMAYYDNQKK